MNLFSESLRRLNQMWEILVTYRTLLLLLAACLVLPEAFSQELTRGPYLQLGDADGETAMVVAWFTDIESSSVVEVVGDDGATLRFGEEAPATHHIVRMSGLRPATGYRYRIFSGGRMLYDEGAFRTFAGSDALIRFVVFGDSGTGKSDQEDLAGTIAELEPQLLVHTGDLVYPDGEEEDYDEKFFQPFAGLLSRAPFVAAIGNHDARTREGGPLLDNLILPEGLRGHPVFRPEENYSFDAGPVHIVVLNSDRLESHVSEFEEDVVPWLRQDLLASQKPWKIAVWHHPPYSEDARHSNNADVEKVLVPVIEETGVQLGLFGHSHNYQRFLPMKQGKIVKDSEPGGVVYVVTGAGGDELYRVRRSDRLAATYFTRHSFTVIEADLHQLRLRQINSLGWKVDEVVLTLAPSSSER